MKKGTRLTALLLALVLIVGLLGSISASAANSVWLSGTGVITVQTGNAPWYSFLSPQITIKNTGSKTATIVIENNRGQVVKNVTALKRGKSSTITLKKNQTYRVMYSGHYTVGGGVNLKIDAKRYIKSIG